MISSGVVVVLAAPPIFPERNFSQISAATFLQLSFFSVLFVILAAGPYAGVPT
jgi:hypothetical protein